MGGMRADGFARRPLEVISRDVKLLIELFLDNGWLVLGGRTNANPTSLWLWLRKLPRLTMDGIRDMGGGFLSSITLLFPEQYIQEKMYVCMHACIRLVLCSRYTCDPYGHHASCRGGFFPRASSCFLNNSTGG